MGLVLLGLLSAGLRARTQGEWPAARAADAKPLPRRRAQSVRADPSTRAFATLRSKRACAKAVVPARFERRISGAPTRVRRMPRCTRCLRAEACRRPELVRLSRDSALGFWLLGGCWGDGAAAAARRHTALLGAALGVGTS